MHKELVRSIASIQGRLVLLTSLSGLAFLYTYTHAPSLYFRDLSKPVAAALLSEHQGFFNVVRWLENLHTTQELTTLTDVLKNQPSTGVDHESNKYGFATFKLFPGSPKHQEVLKLQITYALQSELLVHVSKAMLHCGLLLFLFRLKALSRRKTIPCMCLAVLIFLCWKMAQTCLLEILRDANEPSHQTRSSGSVVAFKAAFLSTLFRLRLGVMAVLYGLVGRAYQAYFCIWPTRWKQIPQYLGSKNLVTSTLYYSTAIVSLMAITSTALRSLSEAAMHIEAVALALSVSHFWYVTILGPSEPQPSNAKPKTA